MLHPQPLNVHLRLKKSSWAESSTGLNSSSFWKVSSSITEISWCMFCRYGGCLGDATSYDLLPLGGPYSVRGYQFGELASSRRIFETAAELRLPFSATGKWDLSVPVPRLLKRPIPQKIKTPMSQLCNAVVNRIPGLGGSHRLCGYVYGFVEHGTDLGISKEVVGNPTQYFRKPGSGSSAGVGIKNAQVRGECIWDSNSGRRAVWVHFGERF